MVICRFKMKLFLSLPSKSTWFLVGPLLMTKKHVFIRTDLTELREIEGQWRTRYHLVADSDGKESEEMKYQRMAPLEVDLFIAACYQLKYKFERYAKLQMSRFPPIDKQLQSNCVGLDLPIPGHIFSLSNPPRHVCPHEPICPIKGGFPEGLDDEFRLIYRRCASQEIIDYIQLFVVICLELTAKQTLKGSGGVLENLTELVNHVDVKLPKNTFEFLCFTHQRENEDPMICLDRLSGEEKLPEKWMYLNKSGEIIVREANGTEKREYDRIDLLWVLRPEKSISCEELPQKVIQIVGQQLSEKAPFNDPLFREIFSILEGNRQEDGVNEKESFFTRVLSELKDFERKLQEEKDFELD